MKTVIFVVAFLACAEGLLYGSPHHNVSLLLTGHAIHRAHAGANLTLRHTQDELAGLFNSVSDSIAQDVAEYQSLNIECKTDLKTIEDRTRVRESAVLDLQNVKEQNGAIAAGLQAELNHIVQSESDASESYDSTVTQRAMAGDAFTAWNGTSTLQTRIITEVLTKLQEKRTTVAAMGQNSSSASSNLDYIIGIFSGMLDNLYKTRTEETTDHQTQDAELLALVGTYKQTLKHIDEQYEIKNAERLTAASQSTGASKLLSVIDLQMTDDNLMIALLSDLCGSTSSDSSTGMVTQRIEELNDQFASLKQEVQTTLQSMGHLIALETATGFLAVQSGRLLPRKVSTISAGASSVEPVRADSMQRQLGISSLSSRKALQLLQQRVALDNSLQVEVAHPMIRRNATLHKTSSALKLSTSIKQALATIIPLQDDVGGEAKKALLALSKSQESTYNGTSAAEQCALQKQALTAQIIQARAAARQVRTTLAEAAANISSCADRAGMLQIEKEHMQDLATDESDAMTALQLRTGTTVAASKLELSAVSTNVTAYVAAGAPPEASGLPILLTKIGETLDSISVMYSAAELAKISGLGDSIVAKCQELVGSVNSKIVAIGQENSTAQAIQTQAQTLLNQHEQDELTYLGQREQLEMTCATTR